MWLQMSPTVVHEGRFDFSCGTYAGSQHNMGLYKRANDWAPPSKNMGHRDTVMPQQTRLNFKRMNFSSSHIDHPIGTTTKHKTIRLATDKITGVNETVGVLNRPFGTSIMLVKTFRANQ
ncbi:hypothetical protein Pan14r_28370 [Crateriforma conspicua]|uniref:Uncharacterized protein n=1 Tax=Crateriforma conspicua TaxID=2527996 RepID=A0A5C5Y5N8_9PLAN|nr:hypothetical protein Pan14r_28370 [Crateriforma conspicua]